MLKPLLAYAAVLTVLLLARTIALHLLGWILAPTELRNQRRQAIADRIDPQRPIIRAILRDLQTIRREASAEGREVVLEFVGER